MKSILEETTVPKMKMNDMVYAMAEDAIVEHASSELWVFNNDELTDFVDRIVRQCGGIYGAIDNGNQCQGTDNYLEALHRTFWVKS